MFFAAGHRFCRKLTASSTEWTIHVLKYTAFCVLLLLFNDVRYVSLRYVRLMYESSLCNVVAP